jgi:Mg2+-importing ATPase
MGASSNFGNVFSMVGASIILPFGPPMKAIQLLTNNLLYDFSQVPIPSDNVDPEQITRPRPWQMGEIAKFILFIGPCSSIFDYTTFAMMWWVFGCWQFDGFPEAAKLHSASLFQTGWFVESLLTQTLIIHVIRTNKIPFLQSWASWPLTVTTVAIMAFGAWLPFSPIAHWLGFQPLSDWRYWPLVILTLFCYVILTQTVKFWLIRKSWI